MKHLAQTLVLLGVFGAALCIVLKNTHKKRASQWLPLWTDQNDEVAFVTCMKTWKPFDASLLKNTFMKATVWSLAEGKALDKWVLKNTIGNKRTAVVFPTITKRQNACLLRTAARPERFLSVDWIIFKDEDDSVTNMQAHLRYLGRYPACIVPRMIPDPKLEENTISPKGMPVVFSRRCLSHERQRRSTWSDAFSGATISCVCYVGDSKGQNKDTSFESCYSHPIAKALRSVNATLIFKKPNDTQDMNEKLYRGEVDINLRFMHRIRDVSGVGYSYPYIVDYRYDRFYAYSGKGERWISSFTLLGQSQALLALLLLSGAAVWLALSVAGCVTFGANHSCRAKWYVLLDCATFIISSLLSTSASTMFHGTRSRSRSFSRTIGIVLAVWLLAMIPLSFYFRAVLTARLSIYVSPNPVDTLDELQAHLDSGMIKPCVVKNNTMHAEFSRYVFHTGSIYEKLRKAYFRHCNETKLTFDKFHQCRQHCAAKPGFVCLHHAYGFRSRAGKNTVESREHLGLGLVSLLVRKNFPEMRAYRNLVQRMSETALLAKLNSDNLEDYGQSAGEGLLHASDELTGRETAKLSELWSFWICFVTLLPFSIIVCCLEIAIGRTCLQSVAV